MLIEFLSRQRPSRRGRDGERGNLIIGMGIMMVTGMMAISLMARATSTLSSVRRTQDFGGALGVADGGLSDAKFLIETGAASDFTTTGDHGEGSFSVTATQIDTNNWQVSSVGTINGVSHAIQARVSRDSLYPYAIFTEQDLVFNGTGGLNIQSYNSATGDTDTGNAVIGSNNAIVVNGGGAGDAQHYFTPDGACSGCPNGTQRNGPKEWPRPDDPGATESQSCPVGGLFGPTIDGQDGTPFRCLSNISFTPGSVNVTNPPAIIYVGDGYGVDLSNTSINQSGAAADFRILLDGVGPINPGAGATVGAVNGVLYAPDADLTVDGGNMLIDGSLTLNSLTVNGNPNFTLLYDDSILDIVTDDWVMRDWQEVPSGTL